MAAAPADRTRPTAATLRGTEAAFHRAQYGLRSSAWAHDITARRRQMAADASALRPDVTADRRHRGRARGGRPSTSSGGRVTPTYGKTRASPEPHRARPGHARHVDPADAAVGTPARSRHRRRHPRQL